MNAARPEASQDISFLFEGREIRCRPGVSLAAALIAADETELRETANGDRRGVFCGMGVCQECRVIVDGRSGVRACMTPAADSLQVARDTKFVLTNTDASAVADRTDIEVLTPEILVIGAGPAGLIAASIAAEAGAEVVVLDERSSGGGQYYKQPSSIDDVPDSLAEDRQFTDGRYLIERMMRSGASLLTGAEVWGAFAPNEFAVFDGRCTRIFKPRRTIVATGAYERGLPVPGWTLPGVMTTGAAQTMLRSYATLPGKRILVAGNGPFNMQVALELQQAGANVVAVAELAAQSNLAWLLHGMRMVLSAPGLTINGMRILSDLKKSGVPVLFQQGLVSVEKTPTGLIARTGQVSKYGIDAADSHEADIVCMGYGFQPNNEILRCLGCRHSYDQFRGHLITDRNPDCETSVPGIYAIGDCCGLSGAPSALQDGVIAATGALRSLRRSVSSQQTKEFKIAVRNLRRHRTFQSALWRLFAAPRFHTELAAPETLICRCENVSLQDIVSALAENGQSIGAIKRRTRLGMGSCQGRYCAPIAADLIARRNGRPIDEFSFFAPRSPLKPIRIGAMLATMDD